MKSKTLLFLFAAASVVLFSCSKDDDKPSSNSGNIVGTWNMETLHVVSSKNGETINDTTIRYTENGDYSKVTFLSDKTFHSETKSEDEVETETGTYSYKNGKLTITPDDDGGEDPGDWSPFSTNTMTCKIKDKKIILSASYSASINEETIKIAFTAQGEKE